MQEFFDEWHEKYRTASVATGDRAEQIAEVAKEVEVSPSDVRFQIAGCRASRFFFFVASCGSLCG